MDHGGQQDSCEPVTLGLPTISARLGQGVSNFVRIEPKSVLKGVGTGSKVISFKILPLPPDRKYRKLPHIRPPFDAQKLMPKMGGGLIHEDLTFCIKVKSRNEQVF